MKTLLLLIILFTTISNSKAQSNPIDVNLLNSIIEAKQLELKDRILSDIAIKNLNAPNYVTYNAMYNMINILTTEKNRTVLTDKLIKEIIEYSIVYGTTRYILESNKYKNKNKDDENIIDSIGASKINIDKLKLDMSYSTSKAGFINFSLNSSNENWLLFNKLVDVTYEKYSAAGLFTNSGLFNASNMRIKSGLLQYNSDDLLIKQYETAFNIFSSKKILVLPTCEDTTYLALNKILNTLFANNNKTNSLTKIIYDSKLMYELILVFKFSYNSLNKMGENSVIVKIGNIISNYVIFDLSANQINNNPYKNAFYFDVESMILSLGDEFYQKRSTLSENKIGFKPFFSIGINNSIVLNSENLKVSKDTLGISNLYYASEKIGIKFILTDKKYTHSFQPYEFFLYKNKWCYWDEPQEKPLYNNIYLFAYGSGFLYNITNLKSEEDFQYPIFGLGGGIEFFNGLDLNLSYATAFDINNSFNSNLSNNMINVGFDIPIFEYLRALKKKNS